jgi:hypothetical protein
MLPSSSKSRRNLAQEERIDVATAHKAVRKQLKTLKETVNSERYCLMLCDIIVLIDEITYS